MENIKKIDLTYVEGESKDNEFENFLWKRAKSVSNEKSKENSNFLTDLKRKLTPNEVVQSISEDIEEYMVDYLKTMEFAKSHSEEIGNFMKYNLTNLLKKDNNSQELLLKIEKITTI